MAGMKSLLRRSALFVAAWTVALAGSAQQMAHHEPSSPSTELTLRGLDGKAITLSPSDLAAMPHKTVTVMNHHTNANETYSGVALSDLLAKVGAPQGSDVKGKLFMLGVVAEGTDHYSVLFAIAETDPSIHTGDILVADQMNGQKLDKDGAFKLVSMEEKRPARWVRNLTSISLVEVKP
jgi:hypothetical protein